MPERTPYPSDLSDLEYALIEDAVSQPKSGGRPAKYERREILAGKVAALVSRTSIYQVDVKIRSLPPKSWNKLASEYTRQIDSLVDLLRGRLPTQVMELVTRKQGVLFPTPNEISFECSCPDWAGICKHVAAALYGVGVRLEEKPELFFELRGIDHTELVGGAAEAVPRFADGAKRRKVVKGVDLSALFGTELESSTTEVATGGRTAPGIGPAPESRFQRRDERSPREEPIQPRHRTGLLPRLGHEEDTAGLTGSLAITCTRATHFGCALDNICCDPGNGDRTQAAPAPRFHGLIVDNSLARLLLRVDLIDDSRPQQESERCGNSGLDREWAILGRFVPPLRTQPRRAALGPTRGSSTTSSRLSVVLA